MSPKISRIFLIALSAFLIGAAALCGVVLSMNESPDTVTVIIRESTFETLRFSDLSLLPGEECSYDVELKADRAQSYRLVLDFSEHGEKTLKNFARVKIISNGTEICDELLADVFSDDPITLDVDFAKSKNTNLNIVYYLPIDVGNEAKNAEADFELLITAQNE